MGQTWLRSVVAAGTYPVLLVAPTLFVAQVLTVEGDTGRGGRLFETSLVTGVLVVVTAVLLVLQNRLPAMQSWRDWRRDLPVDMAHGLVSATAGTALARVVMFGLVGAVAGHPGWNLGIWPTHWPLLAQLPVAVMVSDLGMYVLHRSSHRYAFLWRFHAVHHSSEKLYTVSSGRVHPFYVALAALCATGPILMLGAPPPLFALVSTLVGINGLIQHSNVDLDCRPVRWLIATADAHRWHHSADFEDSVNNFGNTLSWWDRMFGTWRHPEGLPAAVGLADPQFPRGWFGQLARPFARQQAG